MAFRFVEIFLPKEKETDLFSVLEDFASSPVVQKEYDGDQLHTKLLMMADQTESLLDRLESRFTPEQEPTFRIVIVPVATTIPRMEEPDEAPASEEKRFK